MQNRLRHQIASQYINPRIDRNGMLNYHNTFFTQMQRLPTFCWPTFLFLKGGGGGHERECKGLSFYNYEKTVQRIFYLKRNLMNFQYDLKNILTSALKYTFMSLINTDELGDCFCGFVVYM